MTAISKTPMTLAEAEALLKAVRSPTLRCCEDEIPWREMGYKPPGIEKIIEQFGYRGLRWVQVDLHRGMARTCTMMAAAQLGAAGYLRYQNLSREVAVAEHFQVGACLELAAFTWMQRAGLCHIMTGPRPAGKDFTGKAWQTDAPCLNAKLRGAKPIYFSAKEVTEVQGDMVHRLVLANIAEGALRAGDPITKLLKMADVLVIDPFFNFVCPVSQLETRGVALLDYWKAHGQEFIVDSTHSPDNFSTDQQQIASESSLINQLAAKLNEKYYRCSDAVGCRAILSKALTSRFHPQFEFGLKEIAPGTSWTARLNDDGSYDCITKDRGDATVTQLSQFGIQHIVKKNKKTKVKTITLRNPDLQAIIIAAFSRLTGLSAVPVRLILEMASL